MINKCASYIKLHMYLCIDKCNSIENEWSIHMYSYKSVHSLPMYTPYNYCFYTKVNDHFWKSVASHPSPGYILLAH